MKLEVRNLSKAYDTKEAVNDVSFDVDVGEFLSILGPSGCGKTTLLRMLIGLIKPTSGKIIKDDVDITNASPSDRKMGFVFQNYALFENMTVFENVAFSLRLKKETFPSYTISNLDGYKEELNQIKKDFDLKEKEGVNTLKAKKAKKAEIKDFVYHNRLLFELEVKKLQEKYSVRVMTYDIDKVKELEDKLKDKSLSEEDKKIVLSNIETIKATLDKPAFENRKYSKLEIIEKVFTTCNKMGLEEYLRRKPTSLSGGQQQRVAIARTLVLNPDVILFDEPMSALDVATRLSLRKELKRIQKEYNTTMIYITHDQEEAFAMSDRIMVMDTAVAVQIDTPDNIIKHPANDYVKHFVIDNLKIKIKSLSKYTGIADE